MQRWFLSYHSPDQALAEQLKAAIERKDPDSRVFFAPDEPARRRLLVGTAGAGDRRLDRFHFAHRRSRHRQMASARIRRGARQMGEVGKTISAHCRGAARPDRAGSAVPAPTALDRHARLPRPKKTSRACSKPRPAAAAVPTSCGATRRPIAASRPWRKRTAITFLAASARPWRCCRRLPAARTGFRC